MMMMYNIARGESYKAQVLHSTSSELYPMHSACTLSNLIGTLVLLGRLCLQRQGCVPRFLEFPLSSMTITAIVVLYRVSYSPPT